MVLTQLGIPADVAESIRVEKYTDGRNIQKWPYQGIKKFYGLQYLNCSYMLVLDAEGQVLKPMSFLEMFDDYLCRPFVTLSNVGHGMRENWEEQTRMEQSLQFAGVHPVIYEMLPHTIWNFHYYGWFVERTILQDYVTHIERHHGLPMYAVFAKFPFVYEMTPYWWFIYYHRQSYPQYLFPWDHEMFESYVSLDWWQQNIQAKHRAQGRTHIEHVYSTISFDLNTYDVKKNWTLDWSIRFFKCYLINGPLVARLVEEVPSLSMTVSNWDEVPFTINITAAAVTPYVREILDKRRQL
eukprot:TRINITY_DN22449_c0_g1_i1.p1 TRINITY_DN22449_c0_g1~~TRINITY_DN22449_c0_g1_i1.p1  ORF type:complete len:320 (+),score=-9.15 TRINITY_DN22449_c0_g1_i1:74-961(+)